jgi:hypothetical protein
MRRRYCRSVGFHLGNVVSKAPSGWCRPNASGIWAIANVRKLLECGFSSRLALGWSEGLSGEAAKR